MSSLLLEEDKFSFIQENSQKMYQKINDFGVQNKKILTKEVKQVTIKGYDSS